MKKIYFLLLFASVGLLAFADDVDVTNQYIVNAGFDEDISFNVDGTTSKTTADGSLLNYNSGGYYDGFSMSVKGWQSLYQYNKGTKPNGQFEAVVPYALTGTIKTGKTPTITAPAKPADWNTDANTGLMFIRAGWSSKVGYRQVFVLPCAKYRIEYFIRNVGSTSSQATNLCSVVYHGDTVMDQTSFESAEWVKHTVEFVPLDTVTITFGFKAANAGSGSNPLLYIDNVKLYKTGDASKAEIIQADLINLINASQTLIEQSVDYTGLATEFDEILGKYGDASSDDENVLTTNYKALKAGYDNFVAAKAQFKQIDTLCTKANTILTQTSYPGADALQKVLEKYADLQSDGTVASVSSYLEELKNAIRTYYLSQSASADSPADYTFLVEHPWFCNDSRVPASNSAKDVATTALAAADENATGWVNGSTTTTEGSQVMKFFTVGRTCWQCWARNFNGSLDVHQSLANLPNGYYGISADMVTNVGATNDQHIYAQSTGGSSAGFMTSAAEVPGWNNGAYSGTYPSDGINVWETVNTTDKVAVIDGKLVIGARSTNQTVDKTAAADGRGGVFWVTNFKLHYYGEISEADIKSVYDSRLTSVKALCDTMHFAADKKTLQDSIAYYSNATDVASISNALSHLSSASAVASASESKYAEVMAKGKTIPSVSDSLALAGTAAYGAAHDIVVFANSAMQSYLKSASATYKAIDNEINNMKGYTNTYCTAYNAANDSLAKFVAPSSIAILKNIMSAQKNSLTADTVKNASIIATYVTRLDSILALCVAQNRYEQNPNATDYTSYIKNPDAASTDGWVLSKGTGDKLTTSGQYYTANTTHKYFDSYNSTVGKLNYYGYQVVKNIPNGKYSMTAACRTSGQKGAFLFMSNGGTAKADTTWKRIEMQQYTQKLGNHDGTADTTFFVSNSFGKIWEDACAAVALGEGNYTVLQSDESSVNGGTGWGWEFVTIDNYEVTDHQVVIGMTTDSLRTGEPFTGQWFSVTDFSLKLTEKDNQGDWYGPLTVVKNIPFGTPVGVDGIYTITGARVNTSANLPKGIYIVVSGGKSRKVIIR